MNLTSDQAALLARVLAEPADDTPRLLLADAFAEAGDEDRGEFIRLQVRLAELEPLTDHGTKIIDICICPHCVERNALRRRERELLNESSPWDGMRLWCLPWKLEYCANFDFPGSVSPSSRHDSSVLFTRGFVSKITTSWEQWRDHGDAIRRAHPVERVVLNSMPTREWMIGLCGATGDPRGMFLDWLAYKWPRTPDLGPVEFELPPEPDWANFTTRYRDWANEGR